MSEHPPSRSESKEAPQQGNESAPSSSDPVHTPARTAEEQARLDQVKTNLSQAQKKAPAAEVHHAHTGGHHHENKYVKWGVKQPLAIFGYFFSLAWQGIKRWGEMAGKGGGGHAKKADAGGGGGGHH